MGYSKQDRLRDQGVLPGINLDAIRFGHRVERRKPLNVQPFPDPKLQRKRRADDEGWAKQQLRLW